MKLGILTKAPIVLMVVIAGASPVLAQEEDLARALGGEALEVALAGDTYRLPATVKGTAKP